MQAEEAATVIGDLDMQEEEGDDMEVGELDLDGIEKACEDPSEGYIPTQQVSLLREPIIKVKIVKALGVMMMNKKEVEGKRKTTCDKRG